MTGAGMMDCKKALNETGGNMDEAVEALRKSGQAKAVKKESRIAAEGICRIAVKNDTTAAVGEGNSETDLGVLLDLCGDDLSLMRLEFLGYLLGNHIFGIQRSHLHCKIGQRLFHRDVHHIGLSLNDNADTAAAMHIGHHTAIGCNYLFKSADTQLFTDHGDLEFKAHEREIISAQIQQDPKMAGKPEKVIEGAVEGRLKKELKEVCLLEQVYVKAEDGKQTVAQYVAQVAKENSADLKIKRFVRFETGEGLEKKNEDFAAEVAAQMGK